MSDRLHRGDWVLALDPSTREVIHLCVVESQDRPDRGGRNGYVTRKVLSTYIHPTPSWFLDYKGSDWPYQRLSSKDEQSALLEMRLMGYHTEGLRRVLF